MAAIAVVGAGPAGLEVIERLLADVDRTEVWWVERQPRPDGLLRHGPSVGAERLRNVAARVDEVLTDPRVTFVGATEVVDPGRADETAGPADLGRGLFPTRGLAIFRPVRVGYDDLRSAFAAVVLATGAPTDRPLDIAGDDSVGIGTVSHVRGWLAGSPDVAPAELDVVVDSAVVIGESDASRDVVEVLTTRTPPPGTPPPVAERLRESRLRAVTVVPADGRAIGVVGRNRARALRIVGERDHDGLVRVEDLRAQLLLRPVAEPYLLPGLEVDGTTYRVDGGRAPGVPGVYVAGWAGRSPSATDRSHADDAADVVKALVEDLPGLPAPRRAPAEVLTATSLDWSAVRATDELVERFSGEGTLPLADYQDLLEQVDED